MSTANPAGPVILLHNPGCSKSRATKLLLEDAGISFEERLYLENPLDATELAELGAKLKLHPREWVRTGQPEFELAELDGDSTPEELFAAMAAAPILMERPIVICGTAAKVGRPPIAVFELFED